MSHFGRGFAKSRTPPPPTAATPVRRRHRRGFPHLRGAVAPPRFEGRTGTALVVVLPNHRRHRLLRRLLWSTAQRKNHVGETGGGLDPHGHVATCNSTHFFIVRDEEVWTSSGDYCLDGITRRNVINVCKANGIPVYEKNFSLMQVYGADEAFVTGTFAGLTPVFEVDGRTMTHTQRGPMVDRLQALYKELVVSESALPENCSR